jgi:putative FmdB family regulatory protein
MQSLAQPHIENTPPGAYNLATTLHNHAEVPMPHYEFYCHACKKIFSKLLSLAEYEKGEPICPHCGSHKVEQRWSAFSVITSRKSA